MLSALFVQYDALTSQLGVYKLCTIGDAYVAVSEPEVQRRAAEHALRWVARWAWGVQSPTSQGQRWKSERKENIH